MRSEADYQQIMKKAAERIKSELSFVHIINPIKEITPNLCRALDETVRSMTPLVEFWRNNNLSKTAYILCLEYILPQLVSDTFMHGYLLNLLVEGHNNPNAWVTCNIRDDFKRITGLTYVFQETYKNRKGEIGKHRYRWLLSRHQYTFKTLFTVDLHYPQEIVRETEKCFDSNVPMPHVEKMIRRLYLNNHKAPYLMFLAEVLYQRAGEERFALYIEVIIKKYISEFGYYLPGGLYLLDIVKYAFGIECPANAFIWKSTAKRNTRLDTPVLLMKSLIMRTAWPYIYAHYSASRTQAYRMMRLTEEEIVKYDNEYFRGPTRKNMAQKNKVIAEPDDKALPNGSSYDEIKVAVKRYYATKVKSSRVIPARKEAYKEIIKLPHLGVQVVKDIKYLFYHTTLRPFLMTLMEEEENILRKEFAETNLEEVNSKKEVIHLYFFCKGMYEYRIIDYSVISSSDFRIEAKIYCQEILRKTISRSSIAKIKQAIRFMTDMINKFKVRRCRDVTKGYICIWLHYKQLAGVKPSTITNELYVVRGLINAVMTKVGYKAKPDINPAMGIHFYGAQSHIDHRPVIPDDIIVFIDKHMWELEEDVRLMYQILKHTCWRFDDMANLRTDGIFEIGSSEFAGIRTVIDKTKKYRIKNGVGEYLEDVIPIALYNQLQSYIEGTAKIREKYGTDYVFFNPSGGMAHYVKVSMLNSAVNALLHRYGIASIDETYSSFSSSQPRATGATALIEAGVPLPIIQNKLGQVNIETTAKHYARVREKKLAELNREFFEQKFAALFNPETLSLLTEQERSALYRDFKLDHTQVELGHCSKKPCDGSCKRSGSAECAECTKLLTGPQNLPAWQKHLDASDRRIKEMIEIYNTRGISSDIYNDFEEYKEEVRRNNAFRDVIKKINEWKEGRQ